MVHGVYIGDDLGWKGEIYVVYGYSFIKTPFTLEDFEE